MKSTRPCNYNGRGHFKCIYREETLFALPLDVYTLHYRAALLTFQISKYNTACSINQRWENGSFWQSYAKAQCFSPAISYHCPNDPSPHLPSVPDPLDDHNPSMFPDPFCSQLKFTKQEMGSTPDESPPPAAGSFTRRSGSMTRQKPD